MNVSLARLLKEAIDYRLQDVFVAMPAKVESYDAATQLCNVKPLLKRPIADGDGGEAVDSLPVINNVPVQTPRAGAFFLSLPIEKGDTVLLVICDYNIDQWLEKDEEVDPGDPRPHQLDGAVAIPGFYGQKRALKDAHAKNLVIGQADGIQIHITPDGLIHLGGASLSDFIALASKVDSNLQNFKSYGDQLKLWADNVFLPSGCGPAGPPSVKSPNVPEIEGVGSEKIKAK